VGRLWRRGTYRAEPELPEPITAESNLETEQPAEKTTGRLQGQSFPQTPSKAFRQFDLNSFAPVLRPVSAPPARGAAAQNFVSRAFARH